MKNTIIKYWVIISLITWWLTAWYKYNQYQNEQDIEKRLKQIDLDDITNSFMTRYRIWNFQDKSEIKQLLKDWIRNYKEIKELSENYENEIENILSVNSNKIQFLLWRQEWTSSWSNLSICKWIEWQKSFFWARKQWSDEKFSLDLWKIIAEELKNKTKF